MFCAILLPIFAVSNCMLFWLSFIATLPLEFPYKNFRQHNIFSFDSLWFRWRGNTLNKTIWILRVNLFWAQTTDSIPLSIDRTSVWTQFHTIIIIQVFVWRLFISHLFSFRLSCVHGAASFKSFFINWDWELQENNICWTRKTFYFTTVIFYFKKIFIFTYWNDFTIYGCFS